MPSKKSRRKKRTMSWKSRRELFEENKIRLEIQEETEIPVSLEDWMSLSKTDGETKAKIRAMMKDAPSPTESRRQDLRKW